MERVIGKQVEQQMSSIDPVTGICDVQTVFIADPNAPSIEEIVEVLREARARCAIPSVDRNSFAMRIDYLIARLVPEREHS